MPPHLTSRPERVCSAIRPADQELRVLCLSIAADAIPPIGQEGPQARGYVFMSSWSSSVLPSQWGTLCTPRVRAQLCPKRVTKSLSFQADGWGRPRAGLR